MEKNNDIKLTSEEESELLEINTDFQNVLIDLGQVHVKKYYHTEEIKNLEKLEGECKLAYTEVEKKEYNFRVRMNKKYGNGKVDFETSSFIKE